jgi:hypothetical protein
LERTLPGLPESGHFTPQRLAASTLVTKPALAWAQSLNAFESGVELILSAPANAPAYALYQFDAVPGEVIESVSYSASMLNSGGQVWLALADYSSGRWRFLDSYDTTSVQVDTGSLSGAVISPGGSLWLLVLVFDGDELMLQNVALEYGARFPVSGSVVDSAGLPVEGATISMPLFNYRTTSDVDGSFSLPPTPNGNWPVLAAKPGWTFYDSPSFAVVNGGPSDNLEFQGFYSASNFEVLDEPSWNNSIDWAEPIDLLGQDHLDSLSIIDDQVDYFSFRIADAGSYFLEFRNPDAGIYFPSVFIYDINGNYLSNSYYCLKGTIRVGFTVAEPDIDLYARVTLSGGGGEYSLSLGTGTLRELIGQLKISDFARLESGILVAESANGVTEYVTIGGGAFQDFYRPAESTLLTPHALNYTFNPPSTTVNLAAGNSGEILFTPVVPNLPDSFEPNNTVNDADLNAVIDLPYDSSEVPDNLSLNAETDRIDMFVVQPNFGHGLVARLTIPGNAGAAKDFRLQLLSSGGTVLGEGVRTAYGIEARLDAVSSGIPIYVTVDLLLNGYHRHEYQLQIEDYQAATTFFEVLRHGKPMGGVRIDFRDAEHDWRRSFTTSINGTTGGIPLEPGSLLHLEFTRFGLEADRTTRRINVPDSGGKVSFEISDDADWDFNEPDGSRLIAPLLDLPAEFRGTLEVGIDDQDYYQIEVPEMTGLRLSASFHFPQTVLQVKLQNSAGLTIGTELIADGQEVVLNTGPGAGSRYLLLEPTVGVAIYQLSAELLP